MRTRMLLLPALLLGAGCSDGAGPVRLMVGEWGGENLTVIGEPQRVTVALACGITAEFNAAIAPDASGDFVLRDAIAVTERASGQTVTVRGHVAGDQMTVDVMIETPPGTMDPWNGTYTLQRGAPGVTTIFCAAQ